MPRLRQFEWRRTPATATMVPSLYRSSGFGTRPWDCRPRPPCSAVCFGADLAMSRGYMDEAVRTYQGALAELGGTGADPSVLYVIAGKWSQGLGKNDGVMEWYGRRSRSKQPECPRGHGMHPCAGGPGHRRPCVARQGRRGRSPVCKHDMGRGNVLWHLGRPADALGSYHRAAEVDPFSTRACIAAGKIPSRRGARQRRSRVTAESSLQIAGPRTRQACQTKFAAA